MVELMPCTGTKIFKTNMFDSLKTSKTKLSEDLSAFPYLQAFKNKFPIDEKNVIFAYKDTIFFADINRLTPDTIIHEEVHLKQQEKFGLDNWFQRYLEEPQFRLDMEIEAYQAQLNSIISYKNRNRIYLLILDHLASPMYGNIVSRQELVKKLHR